MAPTRDAVGLIDGDERERDLLDHPQEASVSKAFRRDIYKFIFLPLRA